MESRRLKTLFATIALLFVCALQSGCALCCGTYDEAYAGQGGRWQRDDPFHGRVGSPFSDPNAPYAGDPVETIDNSELETIE